MHADLMGDAKKEGHCPAPKDLMGERVHETRVTTVCQLQFVPAHSPFEKSPSTAKNLVQNKEKQCFFLIYTISGGVDELLELSNLDPRGMVANLHYA